jgi:hypothetical protein
MCGRGLRSSRAGPGQDRQDQRRRAKQRARQK